MFENAEIPAESLPTVDEVSWQRLAGAHLREIVLGQASVLAIAVAAAAIASALGMAGGGLLAPVAIYAALHMLGALIWAPISLRHRGYALRGHDVLYRSGVLRRRLTAVPFNRIQHVETTSGVIERMLGLATTVIYTAGGSAGDLKIPGLEAERAGRLRDYILRRAGQADESG